MKIQQSELLQAINKVIPSVTNKSSPILNNIKIEVKNNILNLEATDMDTWAKSKLSVQSDDFSITVPALEFQKIISKLKDEVEINFEDSFVIKSKRSVYKLPTIPSSEFPSFNQDFKFIEINANINDILNKVKFAISSDDTRYYLTGVCLNLKGGNLNAVATDCHKLGLSKVGCDGGDFNIIIPKKSVNDILKINGAKKIFICQSLIKIFSDDFEYTSKLINGEFPNYELVIPKNNDVELKLNKDIFVDCIDRLTTVTTDKHNSIKLVFEKNKLLMTANGGYEEMDIDFNSEKIEIGFNARYLLSVIQNIASQAINLKLKNGNSPALIEEGDNKFVIMPVRV